MTEIEEGVIVDPLEKYRKLKSELINVGDTGEMQCFGQSMTPLIEDSSVLKFKKEEEYFENDIVFCEITQTLSYPQRIKWFMQRYYETGMEFEGLLESFKDEDLDSFEWYGERVNIPKSIDYFIDAHIILKRDGDRYLIGGYDGSFNGYTTTEQIFGRVVSLTLDNELGHSEKEFNREILETRVRVSRYPETITENVYN
jgi:hypothetical protein